MKDIFEFMFPGLMLMWVCFIGNALFADIFEEYKSNTLARMIGSGMTLWEFLVSKVLRGMVVCWICELLLIVFTGIVFDVGWRNPLMLLMLLTSFNLFLMGLLALVYGHAKSTDLANGILVFVFLFSAMLGGSFVRFQDLPPALQAVGQWTMIRLGSYGIESLFQSRPPWEAIRPSLILSAMGLFLLGLGIRVIRKRFESGNVA
ncbi:MAG: ABC transporter permease [Planctomycetes bacterium]|nr:ABC transporter permease [Planctomycetota bacterium]